VRPVFVRLVPAAAAIVLGAAGLVAVANEPRQAGPGSERLPDLDQEAPSELEVTSVVARGRPSYRLGFRSAASNVGAGPLIVSGERRRIATPEMTTDQLIERADAPLSVVEGIGSLRYVRSSDHEHWHLLRFMRYELRRAGQHARLVADRKTGFCLGDRYSTGLDLPAAPPAPVYTSRCGLNAARRLHLVEGISFGYGDDYPANLEGQSLRLTGLGEGRYVLVHRANAARRLRESSYANNASSLLFRLRWRRGVPYVRELYTCPDTARCEDRAERSASGGGRRAARSAG
jgi:hypothetical protein